MSANYEEKGTSSGVKFLIGCSIGCGGLIVLGIAALIGLWFYLSSSMDIIPAEELIPGTVDGFAVVRIRPEDKGLQQAIAQVAISQMKAKGQEVPAQLKDIEKGSAEMEKKLKKLLPAQLVVTMRVGEEGEEPRESFIFSVSGFWRLVDFFINKLMLSGEQPEGKQIVIKEYKSVKIGEMPNEDGKCWLSMVKNNLVIGGTEDGAKELIDRVLAPAPAEFSEVIKGLHAKVDKEQDIVFVFLNRKNYVQKRLQQMLDGMQKDAKDEEKIKLNLDENVLSGVAGHVDLVSADLIKMHIIGKCVSEEVAGRVQEELKAAGQVIVARYPDAKRFDVVATGSDVTVDVEITGVKQKIDELMRSAQQQQAAQAP